MSQRVKKVNELYKRQTKPAYTEIFENADKHYHFNEQGMTDVVNAAHKESLLIRRFVDMHKYDKGTYTWKNGELIDEKSKQSFMYVHLRRFKSTLKPNSKINIKKF